MSSIARGAKYTPSELEALQAEWDARLAAEGMPAEIRPLTSSSDASRDGLVCVALDTDLAEQAAIDAGLPRRVADTAIAQHWRAFSAAIWRLPPGWPKDHVSFLHAYAEHGFVTRAAREAKITRERARGAIRRFEAWRKANPC